jgi:hypothetical protein
MKRRSKRRDYTRENFKNCIENLWKSNNINAEFVNFDIEDNRLVKNCDKFSVLCKVHNEITEKSAKSLLNGISVCEKCHRELVARSKTLSKEEVRSRLIKVYGENSQYDIDKTVENFTTTKNQIEVVCKIHGSYITSTSNFLRGGGCKKCFLERHTKTREQFIEDSIKEWGPNRFGYDKLVMPEDGMWGYVELFCNIHKIYFKQKASNHLTGWCGCPECKKSSIGERQIELYLKKNNIPYEKHSWKELDRVARTTKEVEIDFVVPRDGKEVWIEFNGVQHYRYEPFLHSGNYQRLMNQVNRDNAVREYTADQNNIELLVIPYPDLDRIPEVLDAFFGPNHQDITTHLEPVLLPVPLYYYHYGQNKTIEA